MSTTTEVNPIEAWKPCFEFPEHYEVSSLGRVRRLKAGFGARVGRFRKLQVTEKGYLSVNLSIDGNVYLRMVHVMVAEAFIGPVPEGKEVNHKDGDKANPQCGNLEYVTPKQNALHRARVLKKCVGEGHYRAKYSDALIADIRKRYSGGESQNSLARALGVKQGWISMVVRNKTRVAA
jgi:hypothetical protein